MANPTSTPTAAEKQPEPKPAETKVDAPKVADFVVAPGRSIVTDKGPKGPGETVELPEDEGNALRKLGFFLDEDGGRTVHAGGPATERGVEIKEA